MNGAPSFVAASPRFGLIYDFAGDGRTALKVTVNRYDQPVGLNYVMNLLNPVRRANDTRSWNTIQPISAAHRKPLYSVTAR